MGLELDEFLEAVRAYVREDGEIGIMVDARVETAAQLLTLTGAQIVEMMEPYDFAAIISGCTRAGSAPGSDLVQLGGKQVLSCRKGSGMAELLEKIGKARLGPEYLKTVYGYLSWASGSADISGFMYGARTRGH
ncbi:MAG TPA: hypothetical protein VIU29_03480 [Candidatus Deferrimicrobiaceae bacterium]